MYSHVLIQTHSKKQRFKMAQSLFWGFWARDVRGRIWEVWGEVWTDASGGWSDEDRIVMRLCGFAFWVIFESGFSKRSFGDYSMLFSFSRPLKQIRVYLRVMRKFSAILILHIRRVSLQFTMFTYFANMVIFAQNGEAWWDPTTSLHIFLTCFIP